MSSIIPYSTIPPLPSGFFQPIGNTTSSSPPQAIHNLSIPPVLVRPNPIAALGIQYVPRYDPILNIFHYVPIQPVTPSVQFALPPPSLPPFSAMRLPAPRVSNPKVRVDSPLESHPAPKTATAAHRQTLDPYRLVRTRPPNMTNLTPEEQKTMEYFPEEPYRKLGCRACLKRFGQKTDLARHVRIHSGERPYECQQCHQTFIQQARLTEHVRRYHKKRQYKCSHPGCTKKFMWRHDLRVHRKDHYAIEIKELPQKKQKIVATLVNSSTRIQIRKCTN